MSEDNPTILNVDLSSITDFQRDFHYATLLENGQHDPKDIVHSRFTYEYEKSTWSAKISEQMSATPQKNSTIYRPPYKYDFLIGCKLRCFLPEIKVASKWRGKIRIRWCHNVGHHISKRATLKLDGNIAGTLLPQWMDARFNWYEDRKDLYAYKIGDTPLLTNWSERLPAFTINVPQPWFYTKGTYVALPMLKGSGNVIEHEYKFRLDVGKLLQIQGRANENDEWESIEFSSKYIDGPKTLILPELWGTFAQTMFDERDWHREEPSTYIVDDITFISPENPGIEGGTVDIALTSPLPCKSFFWMAQTLTALKYHDYSNYTTNEKDIDLGWNPCKHTTIKYQDVPKLKLAHDQTEFGALYDDFPGTKLHHGYNALSNCYDTTSLHSEPAPVPLKVKATMHIKIDNTNPYDTENSEQEDEIGVDGSPIPTEFLPTTDQKPKNKYKVYVMLLVTKKIEVRWNKDHEKVNFRIIDNALPLDVKKF